MDSITAFAICGGQIACKVPLPIAPGLGHQGGYVVVGRAGLPGAGSGIEQRGNSALRQRNPANAVMSDTGALAENTPQSSQRGQSTKQERGKFICLFVKILQNRNEHA